MKKAEPLPTPWRTTKQAAQRALVGPEVLYEAVRSGKLRAARINGRRDYRYLDAWIDQWLEQSATPIEIHPRK